MADKTGWTQTTGAKHYFLQHEEMDYQIQAILGRSYYGGSDTGEILAVVDGITDGDFESWYGAWSATAERVRGLADASAATGHDVSARAAYLRAANYYANSVLFIDGTDDPSRQLPAWKQHLACWESFCARLDPPAERVEIPCPDADVPMPGWLFRPRGATGRLPVVIFNNGSDGATSIMWSSGAAGALARGYAALVFDGPGQNSMLWLHDIPWRYDWEKVITPIVDSLVARDDIDPARIALSGLSQGGYWVPRALAFEHRIAAGIADPGVMDVFTIMSKSLPPEMLPLLDTGDKSDFDTYFDQGLKAAPPATLQEVKWRMKPYGTTSYYEWYAASRKFNLRDVVEQITCPMFIADPDDEQFWPGQSRELAGKLTCLVKLMPFKRDEGAAWHCEPKARSLYDLRMYEWLDGVMPPG